MELAHAKMSTAKQLNSQSWRDTPELSILKNNQLLPTIQVVNDKKEPQVQHSIDDTPSHCRSRRKRFYHYFGCNKNNRIGNYYHLILPSVL